MHLIGIGEHRRGRVRPSTLFQARVVHSCRIGPYCIQCSWLIATTAKARRRPAVPVAVIRVPTRLMGAAMSGFGWAIAEILGLFPCIGSLRDRVDTTVGR